MLRARAYIRDNDEMDERGDVRHDPELAGQRPLLDGTEYFYLPHPKPGAAYAAMVTRMDRGETPTWHRSIRRWWRGSLRS